MRSVMRVALALLGLLVLSVGLTAAVAVGSDDTVFTQPDTIDAAQAPITTTPELFSFRHLKLSVRASSPEGVLVATGHPVDVDDYLADRIHYSISGVRRTRLLGARLERERDPVEVPPAEAGFWSERATGTGTQVLKLDTDGSQDRLVIASLGKTPVTVSFGATVEGVFALSLMVAALGGVLLASAVWLMVRRGRRFVTPVLAVALTGVAVVVVRGGLGLVIPDAVAYDKPSKVAPTQDEVTALVKSYDRRHAKALKASNPPRYDESRWEKADAQPMLDTDLYKTYVASRLTPKKPIPQLEYKGVDGLFASRFQAYPMWTVVQRDFFVIDKTRYATERSTSHRHLVLFTRESALSDWRRAGLVSAEEAGIPTLGAPRALPTRRQIVQVRRRVDELRGFVASGRGSWLSKEVRLSLRTAIAGFTKPSYVSAAHFSTAPLKEKESRLHVTRVEGGVMAVATFATYLHIVATAGGTLSWTSPYDSIMSTGSGRSLVTSELATAVIFVPNEGEPTLVGMQRSPILAESTNGEPAVQD